MDANNMYKWKTLYSFILIVEDISVPYNGGQKKNLDPGLNIYLAGSFRTKTRLNTK